MKILLAMFHIQQLGGIINHTEQLGAGLRELGHEVDLVKLVWTKSARGQFTKFPDRYTQGEFYPVSQYTGWLFPEGKLIPYKDGDNDNIDRWKEFASDFDAILWQTPVPTTNKINKGNTDWLKVYDIPGVKNIGITHDTWFRKRNPHMLYVDKHFYGMAPCHTAGYNNLKIGIPKVLIINPYYIPEMIEYKEYKKRTKGFLAAHYFKKIKRMDDLIRAIPYMAPDLTKYVAGYGIEYNYMNSKTGKCKYWTKTEPRRPIYDVAVESGMIYMGVLHAHQRDQILAEMRTAVDPSWHLEFAKYGQIWNRATIEAILQGAILCATNLGVAGNIEGNGMFWEADKNYVMIPYDSTPELFAEIVNWANNLTSNEAASIQNAAFDILPYWDRREIAQQFVDFINGKGFGWYGKPVIDDVPIEVERDARRIMNDFFRAK